MSEQFVILDADTLRPELKKHLEQSDRFWMLRHPLVYMVPFFGTPPEIGLANARLDYLQGELQKAQAAKDAQHFVMLHERPHRLPALLHAASNLKLTRIGSRKFWRLAAWTWRDSENVHQHHKQWEWVFRQKYSKDFMLPAEQAHLDALFAEAPDGKLTVYRGGAHDGLSYSTSHGVALMFAKRSRTWLNSDRNPDKLPMRTREVRREDVLAYTNAREEHEIILKKVPNA